MDLDIRILGQRIVQRPGFGDRIRLWLGLQVTFAARIE